MSLIGTEFLDGQGLGNQLFCYVSARCIALDHHAAFCTAGQERLAVNIHSKKGLYFMRPDLGLAIAPDQADHYCEAEKRIYLPTCKHDAAHGCYIAGADERLFEPFSADTLLYGNLQSEEYFRHHMPEIRRCLKVLPEHENTQFSNEDVCVLNLRGGEYKYGYTLMVGRKYWHNAMNHMRAIRPGMRFVVVTEDVQTAKRVLPGLPAFHFDLAGDYTAVKNAHYLIVSNSSFSCFPVFTSETLRYLIAPKYWARHNVSDGYWASEQNIYTGWNYMDRDGILFSAQECREELAEYWKRHPDQEQMQHPEWVKKHLFRYALGRSREIAFSQHVKFQERWEKAGHGTH